MIMPDLAVFEMGEPFSVCLVRFRARSYWPPAKIHTASLFSGTPSERMLFAVQSPKQSSYQRSVPHEAHPSQSSNVTFAPQEPRFMNVV
jgi:hypothetical protein